MLFNQSSPLFVGIPLTRVSEEKGEKRGSIDRGNLGA